MTRHNESPSGGSVQVQKESARAASIATPKQPREAARTRPHLTESPPLTDLQSPLTNQSFSPIYYPPPPPYSVQNGRPSTLPPLDDEQDDLEIIMHDEEIHASGTVSRSGDCLSHTGVKKALSSPTDLDLQRQLEYYFSRQNLASDIYLVSQMDPDLFVPIGIVANFKRVRERTTDLHTVVETLRKSPAVVVDETGTRVKPNISVQRTTVILRDTPEATENEIAELLRRLESPPEKEIKHDIGNMWYITFESEKDALNMLQNTRGEMFKGVPIAARMKSESILQTILTRRSSHSIEPRDQVQNGQAVRSGPALGPDSFGSTVPSVIPPFSYYYPYISMPVPYESHGNHGHSWARHYPQPTEYNKNSNATTTHRNAKHSHDAFNQGKERPALGKSRPSAKQEPRGKPQKDHSRESPRSSGKKMSKQDSERDKLVLEKTSSDTLDRRVTKKIDAVMQASKERLLDNSKNGERCVTQTDPAQRQETAALEANRSKKRPRRNGKKKGKKKAQAGKNGPHTEHKTGHSPPSNPSVVPDFQHASFPPLPKKSDQTDKPLNGKDIVPQRSDALLHGEIKDDKPLSKEADHPFQRWRGRKSIKATTLSYADIMKGSPDKGKRSER